MRDGANLEVRRANRVRAVVLHLDDDRGVPEPTRHLVGRPCRGRFRAGWTAVHRWHRSTSPRCSGSLKPIGEVECGCTSSTRRSSSCRAGSTLARSRSSTGSARSSSACCAPSTRSGSTGRNPVMVRGGARQPARRGGGLPAGPSDDRAADDGDPPAPGCSSRAPARTAQPRRGLPAPHRRQRLVDGGVRSPSASSGRPPSTPVVALPSSLAAGTWKGAGVLGPEAFDAVPFLDLLAAPTPAGYGSPWGLDERTPSRSDRSRRASAIVVNRCSGPVRVPGLERKPASCAIRSSSAGQM